MVDLRPYRNLRSIELVRALVRQWWGLEVALADARGYVLDHADGNIFPSRNDFCRRALFSKEGFRRCNDSVKAVRDRLRTAATPAAAVHQCHLGFDIVAAPIHIDGELAGFLFTGGGLHEEPSAGARAHLFRVVREFSSADAGGLEQELAAAPRISTAERERLATLLAHGAAEVARAHAEAARRGGGWGRAVGAGARRRFRELVGEAPAMREVFDLLDKIARSDATVLIHGESGTGKELIARAIHDYGPRADRPFVVQNCSAFNDNLLESALFGHVRGAFTGAVKDQKGLFELADGGSFFLDEVGDMSPALQVKLLRVLQEGTFIPVGATSSVKVNVRIIAASHKDLGEMVARGAFREDLYYRINVIKVPVPPLRARVVDLPMLCHHFLHKHHPGDGQPPRLAPEALAAMRGYGWPGNVRELENEIERLVVLGADEAEIGRELLSPRIRDAVSARPARRIEARRARSGTLREMLESVEEQVIAQGLIRTHWNKSQLAKELGISRSNLIQKCSYYGLDRKDG